MKRSGIIRSARYGEWTFEVHNTAIRDRYEVRINRGAVRAFLFAWLVQRHGLLCLTFHELLGVGMTSVGPCEGEQDTERLIGCAIDRWQELRAAKWARAEK